MWYLDGTLSRQSCPHNIHSIPGSAKTFFQDVVFLQKERNQQKISKNFEFSRRRKIIMMVPIDAPPPGILTI
jgi:hypothetical protein